MRWLLSCLLLLLSATVNASDYRDILAEFGSVPSVLNFKSCEHEKTGQEHFVARYQVSGENAEQVEVWLKKYFNMKPLYFICCGWEAVDKSNPERNADGASHYIDAKNNQFYRMTMGSEEVLITERAQWPKIPLFY